MHFNFSRQNIWLACLGVAAMLLIFATSTEAGAAGVYTAETLTSQASEQEIILELKPNGQAALTSDFHDGRPVIVEYGVWAQADKTITLTLEGIFGQNAYSSPAVYSFKASADSLVYKGKAFSTKDLVLEKVQ